jgi:excinuclease UvrABC helicase subunit UvrB
MIKNKDFRLAKAMVEGVLATIDTDEDIAHLLAVEVKSEEATYDITVAREDFIDTLEQNLPHYAKEEEYEQCRRIVDTLDELKESTLSTMIANRINRKK